MLEIRNATQEDLPLLKEMYLREVEEHDERAQTFADQLIKHFKTMLKLSKRDWISLVLTDFVFAICGFLTGLPRTRTASAAHLKTDKDAREEKQKCMAQFREWDHHQQQFA